MSLTTRLIGVIRAPGRTLQEVVEKPRWIAIVLLAFAVTAAAQTGLMRTEIGQLAVTDQWVRRMEAFGQTVTDDRYAQFERLGERAWQLGAATSVATGLLLPFGLAAALMLVFGRSAPDRTYGQALAVAAHAGVILMIRAGVAAPVNYMRESIAGPLTLGTLFPMLDEASPAARFLAMIDLFLIWWLVVLAIGTAVLYRRRVRAVAQGYLAAYVAVAAILALAMLVTGGAA